MATQTAANYPRPELLQVADTVARDKGIDRDEVLAGDGAGDPEGRPLQIRP